LIVEVSTRTAVALLKLRVEKADVQKPIFLEDLVKTVLGAVARVKKA